MTESKVSHLGYIGNDVHLKEGTSIPIVELSISTQRKKKDEKVTQWNKCVMFGKTAEYVAKYAQKGEMVKVDGDLIVEAYETKEGKKGISVQTAANRVILLGKRAFNENENSTQTETTTNNQSQATFDTDDIPF
tara:strand:+ start:604 stop:1005 length:402 start_codon:yes stop_codon:yes gene_type:complete